MGELQMAESPGGEPKCVGEALAPGEAESGDRAPVASGEESGGDFWEALCGVKPWARVVLRGVRSSGLIACSKSSEQASDGFGDLGRHIELRKHTLSFSCLCCVEAGTSLFTYWRVPDGLQSCSPAMCDHADCLVAPTPKTLLRGAGSASQRFLDLARAPQSGRINLEADVKPAYF